MKRYLALASQLTVLAFGQGCTTTDSDPSMLGWVAERAGTPDDPGHGHGDEDDGGNDDEDCDDECPPPVCGDGVASPGEACDDGNAVDGDGCNVDCVISGTLIWQQMVGIPVTQDLPSALVCDASGNVYVGWYSTNDTAPVLGKYAPDGTLAWEVMNEDLFTNFYSDLALDVNSDVALLVTNDDGSKRVERVSSAGQPGAGFAVPYSVASVGVDSTDRIVTGGQVFPGGPLALAVFDASGTEVWSDVVADPDGGAGVAAFTIGPDDGILGVGILPEAAPPFGQAWARRYESDGTIVFTDIATDGTFGWWDIVLDPTGDAFVLGRNAAHALMRRYDPSWNELLTVASDGDISSVDEWTNIAAAPGGDLVIGGLLSDPLAVTGQSWLARRMGPDGATRWTDLEPTAQTSRVAVSPTGRIYAVGGAGDDWLFRAYAP